jgi:hypothetical protein
LHFEKPYSSNWVLDDARSYLQNDTEQFDLIMFSLVRGGRIESSSHRQLRLREGGSPGGTSPPAAGRTNGREILSAAPWIAGRLYGLMEETFGHPPLQVAVQQPIYATAAAEFADHNK